MGHGDMLRDWRRARDLKQKDAAALVGVSRSEWAKWETGIRRPSRDIVERLRKVTGLPLSAFSTNHQPPRRIRH